MSSSWRKEAEALRLAASDDPKRLLQRKNKSKIVDSNARGKANTNSVGLMVSSVVVSALVLALSRERGKKATSGGNKPNGIFRSMIQRVGDLWSRVSRGPSVGRVGRSSSQSFSRTPAQMAGAAAVARNATAGGQQGGKKKRKKKKKRSH